MGSQAIVQGDRITGSCVIHQIPNPATGAPQPSPPLPFSAPLTQGLATRTKIGGRYAAVVASSGNNTPPHTTVLHVSDPFAIPTQQVGRVLGGSATVFIEGKPAATASSNVLCCAEPGSLVPTITDVFIG
jgi:uncharacterized Zn-binding protein involved in type VI secretion